MRTGRYRSNVSSTVAMSQEKIVAGTSWTCLVAAGNLTVNQLVPAIIFSWGIFVIALASPERMVLAVHKPCSGRKVWSLSFKLRFNGSLFCVYHLGSVLKCLLLQRGVAYFGIDTWCPRRGKEGSVNLGIDRSFGSGVLYSTLLCVSRKLLLPFITCCANFPNV